MSTVSAFDLGRTVTTPLPPELSSVCGLRPAGLIEGIRGSVRRANAEQARICGLVSELYRERDEALTFLIDEPSEGARLARRFATEWDRLVAEVGAAVGVGRGPAAARIHLALDLRERLPRTFVLFARGLLSLEHVRVIAGACDAVIDDELCRTFDAELTARLTETLDTGGSLARRGVEAAAAQVLAGVDPDAIREDPEPEPTPFIDFLPGRKGTVRLDALLSRADAIRLSDLLSQVAATVCQRDGRRLPHRQADALLALVEGYDTLGCQCEQQDCDLRERRPRTAAVAEDITALVVIVLNETDYTTSGHTDDSSKTGGSSEADGSGETDEDPDPAGAADVADAAAAAAANEAERARIARIFTRDPRLTGTLPLREALRLIQACNTRTITLGRRDPTTGQIHAVGAAGYRPTDTQLLLMRLRYPHCCFPGCSVPSAHCQADHTREYDHDNPTRGGPTTVPGRNTGPGNLVPLCGFHHRIKTHTGWLSTLLPDGAVHWRHPAGGEWTVHPGAAPFPGLDTIIWDVQHQAPAANPPEDDLADHTRQRNLQRQRDRERYARNRETNAQRRAEQKAAREAELAQTTFRKHHEATHGPIPAAPSFDSDGEPPF